MEQHPHTSQFKNFSTSFILPSFIMFSPNIKSLAQFSLCFWNMFVCLLFPFHSHNNISPFHQSTKHTVTNKCSLKSIVYHVTLFCFNQMNKPYLKKENSHSMSFKNLHSQDSPIFNRFFHYTTTCVYTQDSRSSDSLLLKCLTPTISANII